MSGRNAIIDYEISEDYRILQNFGSKGCQIKYFFKDKWFKVNTSGYEGLSEKMAYIFLKHSNVKEAAQYECCKINHRPGCYSHNFCKEGESFLSLERLYFESEGESLSKKIMEFQNIQDRYKYVVEFGSKYADAFKDYFDIIINLDYVIRNTDRHLNNIGIIRTGNCNRTAPVFDNGAAFFSNYSEFPVWLTFEECMDVAVSKTISGSFENQLSCSDMVLKLDCNRIFNELSGLEDSRCKEFAVKLLELFGSEFDDGKILLQK